MPTDAEALRGITAHLPGGGEHRPGQLEMAEAVGVAIETGRHLVVRAGTGTGKSLAYLVPVVRSGRRTVVATATKALQDQLAERDLPLLADHLDEPVVATVLKGRSNYVCRQRLAEMAGASGGEQLDLDVDDMTAAGREVVRIAGWAETSVTGDRAELDFEPSDRAWAAVSVGPRECPGAHRCPQGSTCFAEDARRAADASDVVVVNAHLYGAHLASGGAVLPHHDVVVFDEAHQLEDVLSAASGLSIGPARFTTLARSARPLVGEVLAARVEELGQRWAAALGGSVGRRLDVVGAEAVVEVAEPAVALLAELSRALADGGGAGGDTGGGSDDGAARLRVRTAADALREEVTVAAACPETHVAWVEGPARSPSLELAPLDVGELLSAGLWSDVTAVLTSATIPPSLPERLGLAPDSFTRLDVGSPFDYEANGLLYCARDLPDPRHDGYAEALVDELAALVTAAGGRTLGLFTSWRMLDAVAPGLRDRVDTPVLVQNDLPKPALLARFAADPATSLLATLGFWQGVDVPGESLSLVVIDRLPFARPDDPLLSARRERAGPAAFGLIDVPRAATMLAQGAGRLIRGAGDRGVVAVCDRRLATASYRWALIDALPPFARTADRARVEAFLSGIRDGGLTGIRDGG